MTKVKKMEDDKKVLEKGIEGMNVLVETYKANPRQGDPSVIEEVKPYPKTSYSYGNF